jgi:hypothetical protein
MIWCKEEKIYVCRRCWEDVCNEGHGKGDKNRGDNPVDLILGLLILVGLFISLPIMSLIDIYYITTWDGIEVTDISDLPESGWVKIEGIILGNNGSVAYTGHEEKDRNRYNWVWDEDTKFIIGDSTGNITVITERYYKIKNGPHDAPNREKTDGTAYFAGDRVTAVCEIKTNGDEKSAYVLWLGEENDEISISSWNILVLIVSSILLISGYSLLIIRMIKQNSQHKNMVMYKNAIPISKTDRLKPGSVNWKKNSTSSKKARIKFCSFCFILCFIFLVIIILSFQWYFHSQEHYWNASFLWIVILPLTLFLPLYHLITFYDKAPNEIAVSVKGVYFYYEDPIMRYLEDDFIGWDEIDDIVYEKSGKSGSWAIRKKNSTKQDIDKIDRKNREIMISVWKEWKISNSHKNKK